jgi:hypothetical protein
MGNVGARGWDVVVVVVVVVDCLSGRLEALDDVQDSSTSHPPTPHSEHLRV